MEEQDYATTYRLEGDNWWFVGTRRICLDWIRRLRAEPGAAGGPILDVGCGTGINLDELSGLGPATGLDLSSTALAFCRRRGLGGLVQGRGEALPFADGAFGTVAALDVVEHIEDDHQAMAEWVRALAPGGDLLVLTSAAPWMWSGHDVSNHHARRYRAAELRALLEGAGLVDVRVTHLNTLLYPPIAAVRLAEKAARRGRDPEPHKDTAEVPGLVNRALTALLGAEERLLRRTDLPFGVSLLASGRRPR